MSDTNMPATEATLGNEQELQAYELAFHVLPTVAEGEVTAVFDRIKTMIINLGGTVTSEEVPARFDLEYEISQFLEGRNRKFSSAYFGWVRFTIDTAKIGEVTEMVEGTKELLRHLLIRLTKVEDANQFYFHPSIASRVVETIEVAREEVAEVEVVPETAVVTEATEDGEAGKETV